MLLTINITARFFLSLNGKKLPRKMTYNVPDHFKNFGFFNIIL